MTRIREKKEPTQQQNEIIQYEGNLVVLAKPGSGKTFTISQKIRLILERSLEFQGVIAISFTNKASKELKNRVLNGGVDKKGSFFDTMTTFYLMEIIYPFGSHIFGKASNDFKVCSKDATELEVINFREHNTNLNYDSPPIDIILKLGELYKKGLILIEAIDALAVFIFDNCYACRRYLKYKYTHIFIDEYQDCGYMQNELFKRLVNEGLVGVAVGDKDQSIYGFSGKSSEYLIALASDRRFRPYYLDKNFRCHQSISDYSLRLLNSDYQVNTSVEKRVVRLRVQGKEQQIAEFIENNIAMFKTRFGIQDNNKFAILVKNNKTGENISKALSIKHKLFKRTAIDEDSSLWSGVFKNIMMCIQADNYSSYEFCEEYFDPFTDEKCFKELYGLIEVVKENFNTDISVKLKCYQDVAEKIYPKAYNEQALSKLREVLSDTTSLDSFSPALKEEIQIMTLHKSKGLEFAVVFHLDLNKFILPEEGSYDGVWQYKDYEQCKNLHYVGITRAEELCVLVTSTIRTNSSGQEKQGSPSEFFQINDLDDYSLKWQDFIIQ
ncbi:ATP-dependent helicase [Clostridium sp. CTA-7]